MASIEDIMVIIKDQREKAHLMMEDENIIKREFKLERHSISTGIAHIITGPRRAGKSVFTLQAAEGMEYGALNFDDERLNIASNELNKVVEAIYRVNGDVEVVIFDEIQEVNGWEKFVSRLVDSKKVLITGSNARMMSKELATHLTGRHIDHLLFPFSFRELLEYKKVEAGLQPSTKEKVRIVSMLQEYLDIGGFPLAIKNGPEFLTSLYKDILFRDIAQRYHIKLTAKLSELLRYLMANVSNEITYNKLMKIIGVQGKRTVQNWISYAENAYLVFKLERFSYKLKESIMAPKKIYAIDTGIARNAALGISKGALMENVVAVELLRRKSYKNSKVDINYWRDYAQHEVDFLIRSGSRVHELIQVTYASSEQEINEREVRSLLSASHEFKCNNLTVITWDYEAKKELNGKRIRLVPLWKWLLE